MPSIWYQEKRDWSFELGAKRVLNSFKYLLSKNLLIDYTCRSKNVYCTAIWKGRNILKSNIEETYLDWYAYQYAALKFLDNGPSKELKGEL